MKRSLAAALALVLTLGALPAYAANAAPIGDLTLGVDAGASGWDYDAATNTLTLDGADFDVAAAAPLVILPDGAKLVLRGESTVRGNFAAAAIEAQGSLTVTGGGTLKLVNAYHERAGAADDAFLGVAAQGLVIFDDGAVLACDEAAGRETWCLASFGAPIVAKRVRVEYGYIFSDDEDAALPALLAGVTMGVVSADASKLAGLVSETGGSADEEAPVGPARPSVDDFADVGAKAWYRGAVDYVVKNDLMSGASATAFAPLALSDRATVVTALWRHAGRPVVNYAMRFEDVDDSAAYAEAVRWAASLGVVDGYDALHFGPADPVNREQLAVMLYRYEQIVNGGGFRGMWMFPLAFADAARVSGWADEAMHWMTMNGVITGKGGNLLDPAGTATRAETAAMLMRYFELGK